MIRLLGWKLAVMWMAVIYWLSSQTGGELGSMFPWVDRLLPWLGGFDFGHFVAYFILALFIWVGFGSHRYWIKAIVIIICVVYGASDEYHQSFVEGRYSDWHDLRNDAIGAALAMAAVSIPAVKRVIQRRLMP